MTEWEPKTLADLRDRAVLLVGYAGGFRRSELVAMRVEDIVPGENSITIVVPKSKTDVSGQGIYKDIHMGERAAICPVTALRSWLVAAAIHEGPVFRPIDRHGNIGSSGLAPKSIAAIVKALAPRFGMKVEDLAGHSLRAGFVTDMFAAGVQETRIKQQTGHRDSNSLAAYKRDAKRGEFNYVRASGLR